MHRIGDVAHATDLTPRAIRYYEQLGLLRPAVHATGGNRRYDPGDVERLQLIKRLRNDVGLSLSEIKMYLDVEELRRVMKAEYTATEDASVQLGLLDRAEPVIRRRMAMFDQKLNRIAALRDEDAATLDRIEMLRAEHLGSVALAGRPS